MINKASKIVNDIRAFNRYYTDVIGVLDDHFLNSSYSLPEARILFEIRNNKPCTSKKIISIIHIDRGYLSRILKSLHKKKLVSKKRSAEDARTVYLELTAKGESAYKKLSAAQNTQVQGMIKALSRAEQEMLAGYMKGIRELLEKKPGPKR